MALSIAADGPLAGHPVFPINVPMIGQMASYCITNGYSYVWDGKCINLGHYPPVFGDFRNGGAPCRGCDCSGFMQALFHYGGGGEGLGMPDGSELQNEWIASLGLKVSTPEATLGQNGVLYLCIHLPDALDETGHIWLVVSRAGEPPHTIESYGGHGPGNRAPDAVLSSGHRLCDLASRVYCLCEI